MKLSILTSVLLDFLTGFCVIIVLIAGVLTGLTGENLRSHVFIFGAMFLALGFLRGGSLQTNSWIKGITVAAGLVLPWMGLWMAGIVGTKIPHLVVIVSVSLIFATSGAHIRRLFQGGKKGQAGALAFSSVVFALLAGFAIVPTLLLHTTVQDVNRPSGSFTFAGGDGTELTNESLRGRTVILGFWATWCPPCAEDLRKLDGISKKYRSDSSVMFLAVNDDRNDDVAGVKKAASSFFVKQGLQLPLVFASRATTERFGIKGLPTLMILDRNGNIRQVHLGYDGALDLEGLIDSTIARLAHD